MAGVERLAGEFYTASRPHFDGDPKTSWGEHFERCGEALAKSGLGRVLFSSPFIHPLMRVSVSA